MTVRNLDRLFSPRSVVLCGASDRAGSVGLKMTENALKSGFRGKIWLVNPRHDRVQNLPCYPSAQDLPEAPDLAIIAVPPRAVAETVAQLGAKGTRAGIVLTAGLREEGLQQAVLDAAKPHCFRILGPNCLGLMLPGLGLNAGFAQALPKDGGLAFLSQSGALVGAVSDWAASRDIGFSAMVSLGDMADIDVGDLLDYFAADGKTRAVLLYLEQVTQAKKFMSAARSAARVKPVIVVKSGRTAQAMAAAKSHTGALAGSDRVYDAAFRRAGLVRVDDLEDLFDAAEILSRARPARGERLAIVTNGGGAGVLAVDTLEALGGQLAALSPATAGALDACLPGTWSHANPVDIIGDAGPDRYAAALKAVLSDPGADAVLVMNCPTALASSAEAAEKVIGALRESGGEKTVLTSWLGDGSAREARRLFELAGIPTFDTPADAVRGFTYLTKHMKAQAALMRVPPGPPDGFAADTAAAREIIRAALGAGRNILTEPEAKTILSAYGIPVVPATAARTPEEAGRAAQELLKAGAGEVVVKILSDDITHKSDQGGVVLGLPTAQAAEAAARDMLARIGKTNPRARIGGVTVQPMVRRPHARELILGTSEDKTFGPVILFGTGGTAVEVIGDSAVSLPPLDLNLAEDLMAQTRACRLLKPYRDIPAADAGAVARTLVRVSQMICDLPEIAEMDINPLLADEKGVLALDARIVLEARDGAARGARNPRFSIRPYPKEWERTQKLKNGRSLSLRPIRPEDEALYHAFLRKTKTEDIYHRFFSSMKDFPSDFIARMTQIDYARAMAFVALDGESGELAGISRLAADPDCTKAEYALLVRSDRQNEGIGWTLLRLLLDYARAEGIGELWGEILCGNGAMIKMCRELGFEVKQSAQDPAVLMTRIFLKP